MTTLILKWAKGIFSSTRAVTTGTAERTGGGSRRVDLEPVYTAANAAEAAVVRGLLESEGIPVFEQHEALGNVIAVSVGKLAEVRLLVPSPLADKARALLEADVELPVTMEAEAEETASNEQ